MLNEFEKFYGDNLREFGITAKGMGWKNEEAQVVRFEQLVKIFKNNGPLSINDLGCGVGDLVNFLDMKEIIYSYQGYDLLSQMISQSSERFKGHDKVKFKVISGVNDMERADYTVASGIFNIRFAENDTLWLKYILDTLSGMNENSDLGFAFNVLTKYSDKHLMKAELYYADPCFLFDHCKTNFSRNVALLHDYTLYDFTILVKKY